MRKIVRNTKALALVAVAGISLMSFTALESKTIDAPVSIEATEQGPKMVFEKTEYQFGTIKQGEKVNYTFNFKNEGDAPLIINSARGNCGCTVPEWPKDPILPGESGEIHVVFNSAGKSGTQTKYVTMNTNQGDVPVKVYLKGEVTVPATH